MLSKMIEWWQSWHLTRLRRMFREVGEGCVFEGHRLEVKGDVRLGSACVLGNNLVFRAHKHGVIRIGDRAVIDHYVLLQANEAVTVGAGAYIGAYCVIRDTNHLFFGTDVHWRLTPHITRPVTIEEDCWIGPRCYIMPGVTIGRGAVIGPASVVNRNVAPLEIWAGNPARRVGHRLEPDKVPTFKRDLAVWSLFFPPDSPTEDGTAGPDAE
ncbi:MAG TPA: acyltransferase [Candidatus Hydrogenedentes bacterium]|nr:acyltransferase [Candidatus Hydrogenedentota bacterium]HOK90082.1 acyltransferase [Candidatus Hydrogenedentota bacterium]HOV61804.1 acyltransferase [Candidatus Hydrogenedentota bacterium]